MLEKNCGVAYFPKCSDSTCFIMSARRVKVLLHHQAWQMTPLAPSDRDEEDLEEGDLDAG
jgi:hypothetical protein